MNPTTSPAMERPKMHPSFAGGVTPGADTADSTLLESSDVMLCQAISSRNPAKQHAVLRMWRRSWLFVQTHEQMM
jgi:hypothetical protein